MRIALLAALLALAGSPALAQSKPAGKAAPKAPAKASFDARNPASLISLLTAMDAKAERGPTGDGSVTLKVSTPGGGFGAQFVGCDAKGEACRGVAFSTAFERRGATLAQLNMFNRTQIACRGFLTDDGRSNVMYSAMLTSRLSAEDMRQHLGIWQGCLVTFNQFTADPVRFLAGS